MTAQTPTIVISPTGTFEDLAARVRRAGLMDATHGYFTWKIASNLALMAACWVALFLLGDSWWQLVVAVGLGLAFVQTGFIAHDTGHKQISKAKSQSEFLGILHMNLLMGTAYGWWVNHHNRHHSNPNNLDRDPDTLRRQVIFHVTEMPVKGTTRFRRFVIRFQSIMFFVLLGQEAWRLHASGFKAARAGQLRSPRLELGLVLVHAVLFTGAVFLAMSPLKALVFILLNQAIFGFYLGAVFAPNHKGMVVHHNDVELDWLHRQVLTSRNIRSTRFTDFMYGGLNYQIEHHLFPSMPRGNLRKVRPMVIEYCREHDIPYYEVPVWRSYLEVARYLGKVSDDARSGPTVVAPATA
ncbi:fatty acid desaturase family protein [Micromonospora mirobrigensis]|uniref:Fatty acid desaturase n=1 Tax=Micromonospora mirobrigensis TaxID=262898 RepID=A0A1C4ZZQ8_9ACTN|nr:fatty acid desaturase [Micromonospora mirobrigensis]SCF38450.1 Fatty acid desaturase [Micromonospora mirobrigensis]